MGANECHLFAFAHGYTHKLSEVVRPPQHYSSLFASIHREGRPSDHVAFKNLVTLSRSQRRPALVAAHADTVSRLHGLHPSQPFTDYRALLVCRVRVHFDLLQQPWPIVELVVLWLATVKANVLTREQRTKQCEV
jgi:hypothetical protein